MTSEVARTIGLSIAALAVVLLLAGCASAVPEASPIVTDPVPGTDSAAFALAAGSYDVDWAVPAGCRSPTLSLVADDGSGVAYALTRQTTIFVPQGRYLFRADRDDVEPSCAWTALLDPLSYQQTTER